MSQSGATLKKLLAALSVSIEISTAEEIKAACELIVHVQAMGPGERECICASHKSGPLFDGDVPSKCGIDKLFEKGYMAKVVVRGEDGRNACTHKGHLAFKLILAGA